MIGYLDTSALVPLLIDEATTAACLRFWDDCDTVVTNRIAYAETAAALAMAERLGRIDSTAHDAAVATLARLLSQCDIVEIDERLVRRAGTLARQESLRGYDAVHCASAELLTDPDLVAAAGDAALLAAWHRLGIDTYRTTD